MEFSEIYWEIIALQKEDILGANVCVTSYDELKHAVYNDYKEGRKVFLVAINPEKILKARKDEKLMNLLNNATYQIADGVGIIYASRIQKGQIKSRVTGIDSMEMLCELSNDKGLKIFLYGAKPEVVKAAKDKLEEKYKNISITGYIDGYVQDNDKVIEEINKSKADIVFVAMGSPKQEYWIVENMDKVSPTIFQGVGGTFDVISGRIKRAPRWMQKMGLEWFYRLVKEPKRIGRQIKLFSFLGLCWKNS